MATKVLLDKVPFETAGFHAEKIHDEKNGKELNRIKFEFKVKSEDYHRVTTLLYKNYFHVEVPDRDLNFMGTISKYSTSITNLYKENQVGDYRLELMEQADHV